MNERMQEAWQTGLDILKPSQKDLEHGLELHCEALVIESYGFGPRAAVDGAEIAAAYEAGASEDELKDMRERMGMTRYALDPEEREEYEMAWEQSGVDCIMTNTGEEYNDPLILMKRLAHFTYATDLIGDFTRRAPRPEDVLAAKADGKRSIVMTGNAVPLAQRWVSVEDELRYVRIFFELGMRMMHITYQRRTRIGDGCAEPANAGLSDFGRSAIAEMNRVGVIVDVAHSGFQTSLEAAQVSERPMCASHSGAHALSGHFRCKPDEVIKAIAETDGFVGVCCIPRFLGHSGDIAAFLDHLEHIRKLVGARRLAIGTDVAHSSSRGEQEGAKVPRDERPRRKAWRHYWPNTDWAAQEWSKPEQRLSMAWTNFPLFTVGMVQRGFSDDEIRSVLGGNVLRVLQANWDQRTP